MERYHIYKLGLAIIFYAVYCGREAVVNGLRADDLTQSATDNRERRDAVDDTNKHSRRSAHEGVAGVDYPNLAYVPKTTFNCRDVDGGYYADLETDCQVFHICDEGRKISFLCPNGTIFQQSELICDWWFKVNCASAPTLYETSAELLQRENAKRKQSRRTYQGGTKQGVFSNVDDSNLARFATPARFVTPSYRKSKDNVFASSTENLVHASQTLPSEYLKSKPRSKTNSNSRRDEGNGNVVNGGNQRPREDFIRNQKANVRTKPDYQVVYGRNRQITKNSAETQELQETASFVQNLQNRVFGNTKKEVTSVYPNHRATYSEIKDPSRYVGHAYSKLPEKPFYGTSVTPQILSTIPVTKQGGYKLTTEKTTSNTLKQPVNSTAVKVIRKLSTKQRESSLATTKPPNTVLLQILSASSSGEESPSKLTSVSTTARPTDTPIINLNVLPLSALPSFDENERRGKNRKVQNSKLIRISTSNEKEENTLSVNFETVNKQPFRLPGNHKPTFSDDLNIHNFNERFVEDFIPRINKSRASEKVVQSNPNEDNLVPLSNRYNSQNEGPYVYNRPNGEDLNNTTDGVKNRFNADVNIEIVTDDPNKFQFTVNDEIHNITTEPILTTPGFTIVANDDQTKITINDVDYTTSTPQNETTLNVTLNQEAAPNPLGIFNDENVLYTSPATIFQPQPFEHNNQVSYTTEFQTLKPYQVSSASPFATSGKNQQLVKTPAPTLPTPLNTPLETNNAINENINSMINILMQVVNQQNINETNLDYATSRPGLIVPPSVGPQTLHSLAVYFANALDNITLTRALEQTTESENGHLVQPNSEDLLRSLLTEMTRQNYDELFGKGGESTTEIDNAENDLIRLDTKSPVRELSVRKLAKVFTEALSSYLEDPEMFKKVIQEARPTEPPPLPNDIENDEDEVLNYSDSDLKFDHPHLSTRPIGLQVSPTWGYILSYNNATTKPNEVQNSISGEQENLQSSDSQSFVSQLNKLAQVTQNSQTTFKPIEPNPLSINDRDLPQDHWTTSWDATKLVQSTLFINPAALNNNFDVTKSLDSSELDTSSTKYFGESVEENSYENVLPSKDDEVEIKYELRALPKLKLNMTQVHGILVDFMQSNKTRGSEKFHRLLDKLNITESEFIDKMRAIEDNPVTRRLILLLISECNQDKGSSIEEVLFGQKNKFVEDNAESFYVGTTSKTTTLSNDSGYSDESTESNVYNRIVNPSTKEGNEDTRALELLNSLYVIAAKFGK